VTAGQQNGTVPHEPARTGICLVRIEAQDRGLLITLRMNSDVLQVSSEQILIVTDVQAAVQAVRGFLTTFAMTSGGR
jgi:hypothetical protein